MSVPLMSAPVITVFKNGDHHFTGKKLVVNRKKIRNFETFLDKVTEDTKSGRAIRNIHTPRGSKVADLANLKNGAMYVAAGPERFKRLAYDKIGSPFSSPTRINATIKPVSHSKISASSRYKKEAMAEPLRNRIIYVYRNGETMSPPVKLLLDKRTLQSMDTVLQYVSNKVALTEGYVNSLYCLETGSKVTRVTEINTNTLYVAVGSGKHFVKVKYSDSGVPFSVRHTNNSKLSSSDSSSTSKKSTRAVISKPESKSANNVSEEENTTSSLITDLIEPAVDIFNENKPTLQSSDETKVSQDETFHDESLGEENSVISEIISEKRTPLERDISAEDPEESNVGIVSKNLERQGTFTQKSPEQQNTPSNDMTEEKPLENDVESTTREKTPEIDSSTNYLETEGSLYKASGKQKETGDEVKDDKNAAVEQLIDAVPAEEVEEEIQESVEILDDNATEKETSNTIPDEAVEEPVAIDESNSLLVEESTEMISEKEKTVDVGEGEIKTERKDSDTAVKSEVETPIDNEKTSDGASVREMFG